jgi:hypothetical protein
MRRARRLPIAFQDLYAGKVALRGVEFQMKRPNSDVLHKKAASSVRGPPAQVIRLCSEKTHIHTTPSAFPLFSYTTGESTKGLIVSHSFLP